MDNLISFNSINYVEFLRIIKKKWYIIVIAMILGGIISWMLTPKKSLYRSTSIVHIGRAGSEMLEPPSNTITIILSPEYLVKIISMALNKEITAENALGFMPLINIQNQSTLLIISVINERAEDSEKIAQAIADIIIERHKILYEKANKRLESYLAKVIPQVRYPTRIIELKEFSNEPSILEIKPVAIKYFSPSTKKSLIIGIISGSILGLFITIIVGIIKNEALSFNDKDN